MKELLDEYRDAVDRYWSVIGDDGIAAQRFAKIVAARTAIESAWEQLERRVKELEESITAIGPFELVSGDSIHRLNPSSRQVVNSSTCWIVGAENKTRHRLQRNLERLQAALAFCASPERKG